MTRSWSAPAAARSPPRAPALRAQVHAIPLYLLWHQHYDDDRARSRLRDLATETIQALFAPATASRQAVTSPGRAVMTTGRR